MRKLKNKLIIWGLSLCAIIIGLIPLTLILVNKYNTIIEPIIVWKTTIGISAHSSYIYNISHIAIIIILILLGIFYMGKIKSIVDRKLQAIKTAEEMSVIPVSGPVFIWGLRFITFSYPLFILFFIVRLLLPYVGTDIPIIDNPNITSILSYGQAIRDIHTILLWGIISIAIIASLFIAIEYLKRHLILVSNAELRLDMVIKEKQVYAKELEKKSKKSKKLSNIQNKIDKLKNL